MLWVLALAAGPPSAVVTSVPAATIVAADSPRRAPCDGFRRNGVTKIILLAPRYSADCPWRPRAYPGQRGPERVHGSRAPKVHQSAKNPQKFYLGEAGRVRSPDEDDDAPATRGANSD